MYFTIRDAHMVFHATLGSATRVHRIFRGRRLACWLLCVSFCFLLVSDCLAPGHARVRGSRTSIVEDVGDRMKNSSYLYSPCIAGLLMAVGVIAASLENHI